jgi:hypothetical protein
MEGIVMKQHWLDIQSFLSDQKVLAAIDDISIATKFELAGTRDAERTELAKKAKGVLESFLQRLDQVTSQARTDVVKGVDPRFKELADAYVLARQDSANFNSTLMKAGTDATVRLLWAEEPRAKRELLACLDDLRRVIQRHQRTDVSAIFEDF